MPYSVKWSCGDAQDLLFTVYTNHNPMTFVLEKAKLHVRGHHQIATLSIYDLKVKDRPLKSTLDVRGVSRMPWASNADGIAEVRHGSIKFCAKAIYSQVTTVTSKNPPTDQWLLHFYHKGGFT